MSKAFPRKSCARCAVHLLGITMRQHLRAGKPTDIQQRVLTLIYLYGETFAYHLLLYRCALSDCLTEPPYDMPRCPAAKKEYERAKAAIAYYEETHNV